MYSITIKKFLKENDLIIPLLDKVGVHDITTHDNYISCGYPGQEGTSTIVIYIDSDYLNVTSYAHDITKNVDGDNKPDIISLVATIKNLSYELTKTWLVGEYGITYKGGTSSNKGLRKYTDFFTKIKNNQNKNEEQVYYDISILDKYSKDIHIDLIKKDGFINPEVLKKYHVCFSDKDSRILFPHFAWNDKTKIAGISGRTVIPNFRELNIHKYQSMLPTKYYKKRNLYGLCWNMEDIKSNNEIIIFEAEKSVMKLDLFKLPPIGVSVGCHDVSDEQVSIIVNLGINNVVIAFDKDVEYEHILKTCMKFYNYTNVYFIWDKWNLLGDVDQKNSPVDCGRKKWLYLYKHKVKFIPSMLTELYNKNNL